MLILMAQLNLKSEQVDYTAAFVHADLEKPPNWDELTPLEQERWGIYLKMPQGFAVPGKVLKLKKSLYGLSVAPRLWQNFLTKKLQNVGFEPMTEVDPCLFVSEKVICLTYVDNSLFFVRDKKDIDDVIELLQKQKKMSLEQDDAAGFLGVSLSQNDKTKEVTLKQTGLIG